MTAGEEQLQPLVREGALVHGRVLGGFGGLEEPDLRGAHAVAADAVDRAAAARRDQPGGRVVGDPVARPALGRHRERLLRGLLGEVEVAEEADQGRHDAAPLLREDPVDDG